MAKKTDTQVDASLTRQTLESIAKFRKDWEDTTGQIKLAVSEMKKLSDLTKTMKINAIARRSDGRGPSQYLQGLQNRETLGVQRTSLMGDPRAQEANTLKTLIAQEKLLLGLRDEQTRRARALEIDLQKQKNAVAKITDLEQLRALKKQAELRTLIEIGRQNQVGVNNARKLTEEVEKRIAALKREAQAIRENTQMQGQKARAASRERLFGDGGANLFAIQAGLLVNYKLMAAAQNALSSGVRFTIEFDEALRNLQAIVRITDTDLGALRTSLIEISEETKFTAVEVAQAAVVLGQAGFSTDEIKDSIRAITLLATATGTDLARSVDIATSTLGVFNMESSQMASVANVLTEAVNTSKLNLEKLTLGLQYSGNIAAQSGVSFKELTSALGAMANAGIRSGSTLGTGMRQILIALQKPSTEFKSTLDRLGLSMADVDLESKGLYGALKNLKDAGFTSADAIRAFEVRAAAAYNALSGNLDQMLDLQDAFQKTSAAVKANETQMKALANQGKRLVSIFGTLAASGLDPLLQKGIKFATWLGDVAQGWKEFEVPMQRAVTGLASFALVVAGIGLTRLILNLGALALGINSVGTAAVAGAAKVGILSKALLWLRANPVLLLATALGSLVYYLSSTGTQAGQTSSALEAAQTAFDRAAGAAEKLSTRVERIDGTLGDLYNRYELLSEGGKLLETTVSEVRHQFAEMGKDTNSVGTDVDGLITSLKNLREETAKEFVLKINATQLSIAALREAQQEKLRQNRLAIGDILGQNPTYAGQSAPELPGIRQAGRELNYPTTDVYGAESANSRLLQIRTELEKELEDINRGGVSTTGQDAATRAVAIKALLEYLKPLQELGIGVQQLLIDTDRRIAQELALAREEALARDASTGPVGDLVSAAAILRSNAKEVTLAGTQGKDVSDAGALKIALANQQQVASRGAAILSGATDLDRVGGIESPETLRRLQQDINQANGESAAVVLALTEAAEKATEAYAESKAEQEAAIELGKVRAEFGEDSLQYRAKERELEDKATRKTLKDLGLEETAIEGIIKLRQEGYAQEEAQLRVDKMDAFSDRQKKLIELNKDRAEILKDLNAAELSTDYDARAAAYFRLAAVNEQIAETRNLKEIMGDVVEEQTNLNVLLRNIPRKEQDAFRVIMQKLWEATQKAVAEGTNLSELDLSRIVLQTQTLATNMSNAARGMNNMSAWDNASDYSNSIYNPTAYKNKGLKAAVAEATTQGILELIGVVEGSTYGGKTAQKYNTVLGGKAYTNNKEYLPQQMTLSEIDEVGKIMIQNNKHIFKSKDGSLAGSSAMGKYQITTKNIRRLAKELGLDMTKTYFTPELQDQMALMLMKEVGFDPQKVSNIWEGFEKRGVSTSTVREALNNSGPIAANLQATLGKNNPNDDPFGKADFSQLMDRLQTNMGAADTGVKIGSMSPRSGAEMMDSVLQEARQELQIRSKAIEDMRVKTSLTKAEQTELNELVREQTRLATFVRTEEEKLLEFKKKQGLVQFSLNESVRMWADQNLNLVTSMESGVSSVLSNMTSGFAQLFSSLSTEPKKAGQAFKAFALSVAQSMQSAIAEMLAVYAMQKLIGMVFPGAQAVGSPGAIARKVAGLDNVHGGQIKRMAEGGTVPGGNMAVRDRVLINAMPGEYILRRSAAQMIGKDQLDRINSMGNSRRMAGGGALGNISSLMGGGAQNIYLVDDRSKVPSLGPNDVVSILSDDMARGGQSAQLIRAIQRGGL